jgi:hypothetical protein
MGGACGGPDSTAADSATTVPVTTGTIREPIPTSLATPSASTAPADTIPTTPSTSQPFVWDVATDLLSFPSQHYERSECTGDFGVLEAGDALEFGHLTGPFVPAYPDLEHLRSGVSTVFLATVDHVLPSFMAKPINLPEEYKEATGAATGLELASEWTPTVMSVDTLFWGDADDVVVLGEFGCYAEGAIASLTPGSTLIVLAEPVDPRFGPYALFGGTHRIVDWLAVDQSHRLTPRAGALGWPTSAPFLEGLELTDAVTLLNGNVKPPLSPSPPSSEIAPTTTTGATSGSALLDSPLGRVSYVLPAGSWADPQDVGQLDDVALAHAWWIVPDCCYLKLTLQDFAPPRPDDERVGQFESNGLLWDLYDIGPRDRSTLVASTTVNGLTISVGAQGRSGVSTEPSPSQIAESVARSVVVT